MKNSPVLEINKLQHSFQNQTVLDQLTFQVNAGEILGMLGPNGAGKSTTFHMITGLLHPDSGSIYFLGKNMHSVSDYKYRIGIVPQDICLYENFTILENLKFLGKLYGMKGTKLRTTVDELIEAVQLTEKRNVEVSKLSGGMKRRINIAAALVHDPILILMDEPTVGIDPQSRYLIWDIIKTLKARGKSIILTSHYVDEIEKLSDRVIIVDKGNVLAEGTPDLLIQQYGQSKRYQIDLYSIKDGFLEAIQKEGYKNVTNSENQIVIIADSEDNTIENIIKILMKFEVEIKTIDVHKPGLSDVFFHFTGRGLRE